MKMILFCCRPVERTGSTVDNRNKKGAQNQSFSLEQGSTVENKNIKGAQNKSISLEQDEKQYKTMMYIASRDEQWFKKKDESFQREFKEIRDELKNCTFTPDRKEAIEKVFKPQIEKMIFELMVPMNQYFKYPSKESMPPFILKSWTNFNVYHLNMFNIKNSLEKMAFINETEERKDELKMHNSFLSFFVEIELKLGKIFEGLHTALKTFDRKRSRLVRDQLKFYSAEVDKTLRQMSDQFMLRHKEDEVFPDVVTSHFNVTRLKNLTHLENINLLTWSLKNLTSKAKETCEDFKFKIFIKMHNEYPGVSRYENFLKSLPSGEVPSA